MLLGKVIGVRPLADRFLFPIHRQETTWGIVRRDVTSHEDIREPLPAINLIEATGSKERSCSRIGTIARRRQFLRRHPRSISPLGELRSDAAASYDRRYR
jgi:hypothetical protein